MFDYSESNYNGVELFFQSNSDTSGIKLVLADNLEDLSIFFCHK